MLVLYHRTLKDVVDKCDDVDVVSGEESSSASETELIEVDSKPKWDCQTILCKGLFELPDHSLSY